MIRTIPSHLSELPIYKQALQIFTLSRRISSFLSYDLAQLNDDGSEDKHIYFTGDIVQQSVSLGPEIINAEMEHSKDKRSLHVASLDRLTNGLFKNCSRLEHVSSNGKDYLPILKQELKIFRQLQNRWMLTL